MNKFHYYRVPKLSISKLHSDPRSPHELVSSTQYNLNDFHLSKSQIYSQQARTSPNKITSHSFQKSIHNAINRQSVLNSSLQEIVRKRESPKEIYQRRSLPHKDQSDLMRRVKMKTEDSFPKLSAKHFCLRRVRKLFRKNRFDNIQLNQQKSKVQEFCSEGITGASVFEPWEVSEDSNIFY